MSFVGKMLIVLQLVLSVMFMLFAGAVYSTQTNWRDKAADVEEQLTTLETNLNDRITAKDRQIDGLTQAQNQATERAEAAEGQNAQLVAQLANEQQKNNRLELDLKAQTGLAAAKSEEASFRDEEAKRQRIAYETLRNQLNEMAAELRDTQDELFASNLDRQAVTGRYNALLAENGDLKKILRVNDLPTDPSAYAGVDEPPPPIDGLVVATHTDKTNRTNMVEISVGSDDGLLKNHEMDVYRSAASGGKAQYLGKIRITEVTPDRAVGYVIDAAKNGIIQRGDNVTTKL